MENRSDDFWQELDEKCPECGEPLIQWDDGRIVCSFMFCDYERESTTELTTN